MSNLRISNLVDYSVGYAAHPLAPNTDILEVVPIETQNHLDGELTAHLTDYESKGVDGSGKTYQTKTQVGTTIKCRWLPMFNTLRKTPPTVQRGERVMIKRMADSNEFFWVEMDNQGKGRTLEVVVEAISATPKPDQDMSNENSYTRGMSSLDRFVNIAHTSKANGEKWTYDVYVDAGNGLIVLKDDIGNFIRLTSKDNRIELLNTDGSHVDLHGKDIHINAPKNITMVAGQHIDIRAKTVDITANVKINGPLTVTQLIRSNVDVKVKTISLSKHRHPAPRGDTREPYK